MTDYLSTLHKEKKLYLKTLFDDIKSRRDKTFFRPSGTQIYVGAQGSGKTISAVYHTTQLKKRYPRSIVVSNLLLTSLSPRSFDTVTELGVLLNTSREGVEDSATPSSGLDERSEPLNPETQYLYFASMEQLSLALVGVNNSTYGVIYLIDEIHVYFNALDSKNIPMFVFSEISQQRKQRKLIIGTSQLFLRAAKPLREQCDNVIVCSTYMGVFTLQMAYDGMSLDQDYNGKLSGQLKKVGWFIQRREIRNSYDTYQKVVSGFEQYETSKPMQISITSKNIKNK